MNYIKNPIVENLPKPLKSLEASFVWGNDGWCYIPQLKIRQKFTETKFFIEEWTGIIPMPSHFETLDFSLYSEKPRMWKEGQDVFTLALPKARKE
jgi:hypothetical protein